MSSLTLRVFAFSALASIAGAQTFDAASVKSSPAQSRFAMRGGPGTSDPGMLTYFHVTLKALLSKAFGVERYQIVGPSWLDDERYDIVAKMSPDTTRPQLQRMLQALLAERFGLAQHRESRDLPVYALVIAKNGSKLAVSGVQPASVTEAADVSSVSLGKDGLPVMPPRYKGRIIGMKIAGKTLLRAKGESMSEFAGLLTGELDRPVLDCTGLTEEYDFAVAWSTAESIASPSESPSGVEPGLNIFAALQTLGLRLEPRKSPVEMLVVTEWIERPQRTRSINSHDGDHDALTSP